MVVDPISDMLNRIRNAQAVLEQTIVIPFSQLKFEIAQILEREGFVGKVDKKGRQTTRLIEIMLKYRQKEGESQKQPFILGLKRISKPGQRIYMRARDIRSVRGGYGIAIFSTPKGLMTNKEARRQKLGGEKLFEIW